MIMRWPISSLAQVAFTQFVGLTSIVVGTEHSPSPWRQLQKISGVGNEKYQTYVQPTNFIVDLEWGRSLKIMVL